MHIFPPLPFNAKFENVPMALHPPNSVHSKPQQRANYYSLKVFLMTYLLTRVGGLYSLHTDRQTDDRRQRCQESRTA